MKLILHLAELKLRGLNVSQVERVYSTNAGQPEIVTDVHHSRTKTRAIQKKAQHVWKLRYGKAHEQNIKKVIDSMAPKRMTVKITRKTQD